MPRFYFDVREGRRFAPDTEGSEFESLDAAEHKAATVAADIGRDMLPKGDARQITVEMKNERHQRLLTVTVSMEIHRVVPEPAVSKAAIYRDQARSIRQVAAWVSGQADRTQLLQRAEHFEAQAEAAERLVLIDDPEPENGA
ncbi:DUF6894 family protein [Microvirga pudoricolor]|uniref:DUF6894 family protein n=1 Tax=Microvirga pudoricolor TaxID=2778729 RepID=UPI0019524831|nr:hypothetical protein [Microvirga pudoricolor]MBM6595073.1 hypothetical protein [Microvirga pudoricolor]